jgi:hypothetical protein
MKCLDYHTWYFHSLMTIAFWRQNILESLHLKCSAPLHSWSDSPIGCSTPLYSRSGSLIGSAYYFLYINFCFRFNKSVTNLTLLRQHHLQYKTSMKKVTGTKTPPNFETIGCIFRCVRPFYERAVSDLDRSMHRSLWV